MNNQEYEQKKSECWEEYFSTDKRLTTTHEHEVSKDAFYAAFNRAYALGQQEKDAEDTVISGWAARDEDENLFMYNTKPERDETIHMWMGKCVDIDLRNHLFPNLTWDDDPQEVEIIIKRKKK